MSIRVRGSLVVLLALGGCNAAVPDFQASVGTVRPSTGPANARGASVAIASLDGPPEAVAARFDTAFAREAATHGLTMAGPTSARVLIRGYMSASPAESGGTEVAFVYDLFDAGSRQRVSRVADILTLPGSSADPWTLVDDRVAASLAGRSADGIAAALASTPSPSPTLALAGLAPPN